MNLDLELVKKEFPRSDRIYLNNASSSLIPTRTIKSMMEFIAKYNEFGPDSTDFSSLLKEKTNHLRSLLSKIIGCNPDEIIFTQSTTEGINLVANGLTLSKNSNLIIRGTTHEHHSNYYPWLKASKTADLRSLSIDENGFFEIKELEKLTDENTKLVALSHALYNTGAIMPVNEVGKVLQEKNIPYFLDAAQTVGCIGEINFPKTGADFMAFNGYKWLCGPMGIGVFVCRKKSADLLEPLQVAGESSMLYDTNKLAHKEIPEKFQAGFRNFVAIAGLESSVRLLLDLGLENIREKIADLASMLRDEVSKIPGSTVYGPSDRQKRTSIVSFTLDKKTPQEIVEYLEKEKIILAVREISDRKVVRASPHFFNTESDIQKVSESLKRL